MRILFCSPAPLSKALGGPKVVVELAEGLRALGWDCELRGRCDLTEDLKQSTISDDAYTQHLYHYLRAHCGEYDVVDYDHNYLPYARSEFAPQTLFVARSVLLAHHFDAIPIPIGHKLKSRTRHLLYGARERRASVERTQRAHRTIQEADLVNVCNEDDKTILIESGIAENKIVVVPFGISESRRQLFDAVSSLPPEQPLIAFVGTFDYRKGAREFPAIVQAIVRAVPEACFRLLGTGGMFPTAAAVLAHFPRNLRQKIEVIPKFRPEELPRLLSSCAVGIFPSHIEGMPFGVLEMMAASVPVIAYDAPGPPMMLPPENLVPRGDTVAMSVKVVDLLTNAIELRSMRVWARQQSQKFCWAEVAQRTNEIYRECWQKKQ